MRGLVPKYSSTMRRTSGTRVEPPTRITSSTSFADSPASASALSQTWKERSRSGLIKPSNSARAIWNSRSIALPSLP